MYLQWLHVDYSQSKLTISDVDEMVDSSLLTSLYQNGQCESDVFILKQAKKQLTYQVRTPEKNSFSKRFFNKWVRNWAIRLKEKNITYTVELIAKEYDSVKVCRCVDSSGYIIRNTENITEVVWCIDCDGFIPLYKLPPIEADSCYRLVSWNEDYHSCDQLQLRCDVLEHVCLAEMYSLHSNLNKIGLSCRDILSKSINKPIYYPLYRYYASTGEMDKARKCPSCGGEWLLKKKWKEYDFRCDRCHLVSNLAYMFDF